MKKKERFNPQTEQISSKKSNEEKATRGGGLTWKSRYTVEDGDETVTGGERRRGDPIRCSGKYCKSCTAGLIADCVALCCCPCAVLNFLTLAFVKVPWKIGRRCLGLGKKRRKMLENKSKSSRKSCDRDQFEYRCSGDHAVEEEIGNGGLKEIPCDKLGEMESVDEKFEAEKVWLELYQVGHLGFGRVSSGN